MQTNLANSTRFFIGQEVVRSKGGYVVGRLGEILEIDNMQDRVHVWWKFEGLRTWVSISVIAPTSIPYAITEGYMNKKTGRWVNGKYVRL